jgi:hypothetical protein
MFHLHGTGQYIHTIIISFNLCMKVNVKIKQVIQKKLLTNLVHHVPARAAKKLMAHCLLSLQLPRLSSGSMQFLNEPNIIFCTLV